MLGWTLGACVLEPVAGQFSSKLASNSACREGESLGRARGPNVGRGPRAEGSSLHCCLCLTLAAPARPTPFPIPLFTTCF